MSRKTGPEQYTEQETIARREAALKRMLSTPHKPHKPLNHRKSKTQGIKLAKEKV
ncbi:MAG: hypothetical protein ACLPKB_15985 [Xanthobacteraceae bacterium]